MKAFYTLCFLAMLMAAVQAYCPNLCSGHGSCGQDDKCTCYTQKGTSNGNDVVSRAAWTGADCSLRTCPLGTSWTAVSTATGANNWAKLANTDTSGHMARTMDLSNAANLCSGCTLVNSASGDGFDAADLKRGTKITISKVADGTDRREYTVYSSAFDTNTFKITFYEALHSDITGAADGVYQVNLPSYDDTLSNTDAKPANAGGVHAQVECSGVGNCNRETGECECFDGYSGEACARTSCPDDCSGHGICQSLATFALEARDEYFAAETAYDASAAAGLDAGTLITTTQKEIKQYNGWDSKIAMGCKCDSGFRGPNCAQIECPSYRDPMFGCGGGSCNDKTIDDKLAYDVSTATKSTTSGVTTMHYSVCANSAPACTSNEQRDCSGRGICDYTTGQCQCFSGFYGEACHIQTILV
jgi:hypothetical protein